MSLREIYFLQHKIFNAIDDKDGEPIEENKIIGYFSSKEKLNQAINLCKESGIEQAQLCVENFKIKLKAWQKSVCVLTHEYSVLEPNGSFTDFEYIFAPKANKSECKKLMRELECDVKYSFSKDRIYDAQPPKGFLITRFKLDVVWYPVYRIF